MTIPPVKATEALDKPPAAKLLRSRWIIDDDLKPKVNINYRKVPICFSISGIASFDR